MIRIIPFTAWIEFGVDNPPIELNNKFYELLTTYHLQLQEQIKNQNLIDIKKTLEHMQSITNLIQSIQRYIEPVESEIFSDGLFKICDFQKQYFELINIKYSVDQSKLT